jgi:hypothetical protein
MPVTDLNAGNGIGYRNLARTQRLGLTPAGNALPCVAPLSVANAGRFPLARGVFISYAPQLRALFHARDPSFNFIQAALVDLTSANPLLQSNVRTLLAVAPYVSDSNASINKSLLVELIYSLCVCRRFLRCSWRATR